MYHSTLGLGVINKRKKKKMAPHNLISVRCTFDRGSVAYCKISTYARWRESVCERESDRERESERERERER